VVFNIISDVDDVEGVRVVVFNIISDVDDVQGVRVVVFNIISDVDDVQGVRVVVFNIIFNNIAVISWRSVLLVEETGAPGENHRPITSD
jgi:hypothetical protein